MITVAIGPQARRPSWNWVGFDLARELAKYFKIRVYESTIPRCDVAIAVKMLPPQAESLTTTKVIYLPIDQYERPADIKAEAAILGNCAAIGCHSEPLMAHFLPYCKNVFFVNHHAKYSLPHPSPFKERGFVLWVGAFQHVPYLLKWCDMHPLGTELRILTDLNFKPANHDCGKLADRLHVRLNFTPAELNGHRVYQWTERCQLELMMEAKAAIDLKGGHWLGEEDWWQRTKPPTKGQKFVTSGIPFATNSDSYCFEYFKNLGLNLASPDDPARWLSYEYWDETSRLAAILRPELSLDAVGSYFKSVIESVLECSAAGERVAT